MQGGRVTVRCGLGTSASTSGPCPAGGSCGHPSARPRHRSMTRGAGRRPHRPPTRAWTRRWVRRHGTWAVRLALVPATVPPKTPAGARCLHRGLGALSEQPCPAETAPGFCPRLRVQRRRACCTGWPGSWSAGSVPSAETRDDPSGGQGRGPRRSRFGGEGHAEGAVQRMGGDGLGPGERAEVGAREPRAL